MTAMGIDFSKIKLVIWDLDETLWKGILSEGTMQPVESNNQLIRNMTDAGVVNSICSKNDPNEVDKALKEMGLEDYFVFLGQYYFHILIFVLLNIYLLKN